MYGPPLAWLAYSSYRVQALTPTQPQGSEIAQTASNEVMPIGHGVTGDDDDDADPAPVGSESVRYQYISSEDIYWYLTGPPISVDPPHICWLGYNESKAQSAIGHPWAAMTHAYIDESPPVVLRDLTQQSVTSDDGHPTRFFTQSQLKSARMWLAARGRRHFSRRFS